MYPSLGTVYTLELCGTLLNAYNLPEIDVATEYPEFESSYSKEGR